MIAKTLYRWYPKQFPLEKIDHLLKHEDTLEAIKADKSTSEIRALWKPDLEDFKKRREKYLIYN